MNDLKRIIANNIQSLRSDAGMTQNDLAEKLSYSGKSVSKWERGESLPDITVIKQIADLFGVKIDYLVEEVHTKKEITETVIHEKTFNRSIFVGISIVLIWLVASLVFVVVDSVVKNVALHWLSFVYAVPCSIILWLIFDAIWFKRKRLFLLLSILNWTLLGVIYITLLIPMNMNFWIIFIIGIPLQVIIILASQIKFRVKDNKSEP